MTVQEAKCQQCNKKCPQEKLASDIAKGRMYATNEFIQCQKELEKYRALGTVEELKDLKEMNKNCTIEQLTGVECSYNETGCSDCKGKQALLEAMEKQVAKKVMVEDDGDSLLCPSCGLELMGSINDHDHDPYYCFECGQALKWGEEE